VSTSFQFVQKATAVGPYPGLHTDPSVTFAANVAYGDIILAFWGAYYPSTISGPYPSGVTDSLGNAYTLIGQNAGNSGNGQEQAYLWIATDVKGGACTVTFASTTVAGLIDGPSLIVAEYETPGTYEWYGIGAQNVGSRPTYNCTDPQINENVSGFGDLTFRLMANNGSPGGGNCSDTGGGTPGTGGLLDINLSPDGGYAPDYSPSNLVGCALVNQFLDVLLIEGNYNGAGVGTPYWQSTSGATIRAFTIEPAGGGGSNIGASGALADQDFRYLHGPLQANCGDDPNGTVGVAYTTGLIAAGGGGTYTWSLIGGNLPPGLTLNTSTGVIGGTPTAPGKFTFTVQVTDGSQIVTITCVISICPAATLAGAGAYGWTG
jgi:hypothetical protein